MENLELTYSGIQTILKQYTMHIDSDIGKLVGVITNPPGTMNSGSNARRIGANVVEAMKNE